MRQVALLFLLPLITLGSLGAQTHYTVQLGAFVNARSADFDAVRHLGFVYAQPLEDNVALVLLGGYATAEEAEAVAIELKRQGYVNAGVLPISFSAGQNTTVIQVAIRDVHRPIEWDRFTELGNLYGIIEGNRIRILTGVYPNADATRDALNQIRAKGYADAFSKTINTAQLIAIGPFETGTKQPLIPLSIQSPGTVTTPPAPTQPTAGTVRPTDYDDNEPQVTARSPVATTVSPVIKTTSPPPPPPTSTSASELPSIRPNVKRRSALDLQTLMKSAGFYQSSLDGLYGPGTAASYQSMLKGNRELIKYQLLAQHLPTPSATGVSDPLQDAINELPTSPAAVSVIDRSTVPLAFAYQAYRLFTSSGPSARVNTLMNQAISQAYTNKPLSGSPPFDYRATYAYQGLDQLILHLHYIHLAPGNAYALPCWLTGMHPAETARAREAVHSYAGGNLLFQGCDPFLEWPEVKLLYTIASDFNDDAVADQTKLSAAASARAQLYLADDGLTTSQLAAVEVWRQKLMDNLNAWATRDPLHQRMAVALRVVFYQSQVRLEDYYLNQEFNEEEAKGLALATLQTLVGYHLSRFTN